jgi:nucleotide-binding universal stress UspA family protein
MYKTILLPLALDQGHGSRSMEIARRLRAEGGKIIAVHVLDKIPSFASYYMSPDNEKMPSDIEKEIQAAAIKGIAERIGPEKDVEAVVLTGHPGRTITDYAEKIGADCIIVGSHRPEMKDFFLGSTAARVMRYAPCSVHVLR